MTAPSLVTFDSSWDENAENPETLAFDSGATGSDRLLIAGVLVEAETCSGLTYNGSAATAILSNQSDSNGFIANILSIFRLASPSTGSNTLSASLSADPGDGTLIAAVYENVDQSSPIGAELSSPLTGTTNPAGSVSTTLTTTQADSKIIVVAMCDGGGTASGDAVTPLSASWSVVERNVGDTSNVNRAFVFAMFELDAPTAGNYTVGANIDTSSSNPSYIIHAFELKGTSSGGSTVSANTDALTLTEQAASVSLDVNVSGNTDALTLNANQATVSLGVNIEASPDSLTLTENAASLTYDVDVRAGTDSLSLTGNQASVAHDINLAANTASLTLSEHQASVTLPLAGDVKASTAALSLTAYRADVKAGGRVRGGGMAYHVDDIEPSDDAEVDEIVRMFLRKIA